MFHKRSKRVESMELIVAEERVESDNPEAEEESKNEHTVISGDEGNFESCKNPVIVDVDHHAEVASFLSRKPSSHPKKPKI
ncbi:hypothetical protein V6N13_030854 [Hibiscus sabdariffa]|uniref:Uncharacterized protein n=2 Tax=Hibiscus sabdariffa TaxID=183260 RepID=A0ABR2A9F5_9ROSI